MTSAADRALVVNEFDSAIWPSGSPNLTEAALAIYEVLLWYEGDLPHIIEANELARRPWRERAELAEQYLATQLSVPRASLPSLLDRMMRLPRWTKPSGEPMQRHNPLGNGLRTLVAETLQRWGAGGITYIQEAEVNRYFPGLVLPGRSLDAKIDVLAVKGDQPVAVISCKWSGRHDRNSDPTNECPAYKKAALDHFIPTLRYFVLTAECYWSRLMKLLDQPCIDGLVHVHSPLFAAVEGTRATPVTGHAKFLDLTELVALTPTW